MRMDIVTAISKRTVVVFEYEGHRQVVEPYVYFLDRGSTSVLSGYQLGTATGSGWRLYVVAKIYGFHEIPDWFRLRTDYRPREFDAYEVFYRAK